jgi:hypothetical protein
MQSMRSGPENPGQPQADCRIFEDARFSLQIENLLKIGTG